MDKKTKNAKMAGIKSIQEEQRKKMRENIDAEIRFMRKNKETITITALAEALGVSRSTLYSPYIRAFLLNYPEFNPEEGLPEVDEEHFHALQNRILVLEAEKKEMSKKYKAVRAELAATKAKCNEYKESYERVLGRFQEEIGAKITHL